MKTTNLPSNYTMEQYQAWLETNPPISLILRVQRSVTKAAVQACKVIAGLFKRKTVRSCIWKAGLVAEPTAAECQGINRITYPKDWVNNPDQYYQYRCQRMYENLQREIDQEETVVEALGIIQTNK